MCTELWPRGMDSERGRDGSGGVGGWMNMMKQEGVMSKESGGESVKKEVEWRSGDVQPQNSLPMNELSPVPPWRGDVWFTQAAFD